MDSCYQDQMMSLPEALQALANEIKPVGDVELIPLGLALGRVLAVPVESAIDVPPHRNSAMDGYALAAPETLAPGQRFELAGVSLAGKPYTGKLQAGQCVRIMTGACVPEGADTVVMQEHVELSEAAIALAREVKPGQNVRHPGEDIQSGQRVFEAGRRLGPVDLGVLASVGCANVQVYRRLNVAMFCTGDELRQPGEPLAMGDIYNSNRFMLRALLEQAGVEVLDLGSVADEPEALESTIREAANCDAFISTGGVSVGDADYVKPLMQKLGEIGFWKVAIKPGKPFAFGRFNNSYFFGLPGNPVSSAVTYRLLVEPALTQLSGADSEPPRLLKARLLNDVRKRAGREEYVRASLSTDASGELQVSTGQSQGSHQLRQLAEADCLLRLAREQEAASAGDQVEVLLY